MSQLQSPTAFSGPRTRIGISDPGQGWRSDDIVDIRRIFQVVWQQRSLIRAIMALGLLLGVLVILVLPPKFTATATIMFEPRETVLIAKEGMAPPRIEGSQVDNQVEIIQSSDVVARAVKVLIKRTSDVSAANTPSAIVSTAQANGQAEPVPSDAASGAVTQDDIDWFRRQMRVKRRQETHLIDISFSSSRPDEAARLANGMAQTFIEMQLKSRAEEIREFNQWIATRVVELNSAAVASEKRMEEHKAKHNLLDPSAITELERRLFQINEQLELARVQSETARDRLVRVKEASAGEGIQPVRMRGLRSERVNELILALGEVSKREDEANATSATIASLQERRRQLESEIGREVERIVQGAEEMSNGALEQIKRLEAQKQDLQNARDRQTDAAIKLREMAEQVEVNRSLNRTFDTRARELSAQLALLKPNVQIVAQAIEPTRKSSPGKSTILALALLASSALGIGGALLAEQLNRTFRTLGDINTEVGLAPLGEVGFEAAWQKDPFARPSAVAEDILRGIGWSAGLFRGKEPPKILAFVSAVEQEGRSTLAATTAVFHASRGLRVLLVDADLRRPRLTTHLAKSMKFKMGLNELLLKSAPFENLSIQKMPETKLAFMPATSGDTPGNPDALINPQFAALLDANRGAYDLIIVDTPPLTTSAEARFVLECCDKAVLVVRAASTSPAFVRTALQMSRASGDRFVGALLNHGGQAPGTFGERLRTGGNWFIRSARTA